MNSEEVQLTQINNLLGGGITSLLKDVTCKLYFEGKEEVKLRGKTKKPCNIYIINDLVLICRPCRYSRKYYVKFQLSVSNVYVESNFSEQDNSMQNEEVPSIILFAEHARSLVQYFIWYIFLIVSISLVGSLLNL